MAAFHSLVTLPGHCSKAFDSHLCFASSSGQVLHSGVFWEMITVGLSSEKPHLSLHPFECPRADFVSGWPRTEDGEGWVTPGKPPHLRAAVPGPWVLSSPITALLSEGYFDRVKLTLWGKEHKLNTIC